jgi:hypothetical protein
MGLLRGTGAEVSESIGESARQGNELAQSHAALSFAVASQPLHANPMYLGMGR